MMERDGGGFWTGDVRCDKLNCAERLEKQQIQIFGLHELGWQTTMGRHYCHKHHTQPEVFEEHTTSIIPPLV